MTYFPNPVAEPLPVIDLASQESLGPNLVATGYAFNGGGSVTWFSANAALFIPLTLPKRITAQVLWWANGATVGYNVDCGVYDFTGTLLFHTGNTLSAGVSTIQAVSITATAFGPGRFYMAISCANASQTFQSTGDASAAQTLMWVGMGVAYMAGANPLPANATLATLSGQAADMPQFGLATRSFV